MSDPSSAASASTVVAGRVHVACLVGMGVLGSGERTTPQLVTLDGATAISANKRSVWVVDPGRNEIRRLSPGLRTPLGGPILGVVGDVEEVDGVLWIVSRIAGTVTKVEPAPL